MNISFSFYARVVWNLLRADFIHFRSEFLNKCLDLLIWVGITVLATGYLMSAYFKADSQMGAFFLAGCVASVGLFDTYPRVFTLVNDFESEQTIFYYLNLPIPSWMVILKTMIFYTVNSCLLALPILPFGKLMLWNEFSFGTVSWVKLVSIYILTNMFYATVAFLAASFIPNVGKMERLWMRCIFPLWFLGGFNNSWETVNNLSRELGIITLCNPMTYIMEGTREAVLGTTGPLSFGLCIAVIAGCVLLGGFCAIIRLKKRLDFV